MSNELSVLRIALVFSFCCCYCCFVVVIFPKSNLAFLEVLQIIWFIKGGVEVLSLERTGFRVTADFVKIKTKSAVTLKPVRSKLKS